MKKEAESDYKKYKPVILKAIKKYTKTRKGKATRKRFEHSEHRREYKRMWIANYRQQLKKKLKKSKST